MITIRHHDFGWGGLLTIDGHSGAAEYGTDVVCAGVSSITVTLCRMLDGKYGCKGSYRSGAGRIQYLTKKKTKPILEFALEGYRWMAEEFPDYITFEETKGAG